VQPAPRFGIAPENWTFRWSAETVPVTGYARGPQVFENTNAFPVYLLSVRFPSKASVPRFTPTA
jgi:hypothetical protein